MLMKLALRNVRRSMRDYAVYFVTLTLGVAVFYAFNAIEDSRVLFEAQEGAANVFLASGASIFDILAQVMTYFSVVVAVVLGFLVLYANRFVVRARKKEFGTYLLLGMSPRQVSSVLLMEPPIVGVIAPLPVRRLFFGAYGLASSMISRSEMLTCERRIPICTVTFPRESGSELIVPVRFMLRTLTDSPSLKSDGL